MHKELRLIIEIRMMKMLKGLRKLFKYGAKDIFYIGGSDVLPPPLEKDEEQKLLDEYAKGSLEARSILIERNLRLVVYIAKRFESAGVNVEDLISIGTIGLIKAVNTFKMDKNIKLATYWLLSILVVVFGLLEFQALINNNEKIDIIKN